MDSHRRVGARRWRCEIAEGAEQIGRGVLRRARAQHLAVFPQESDIMGKRRGLFEFYITVRPSTVLNRRDLDFSSAILKLGMIRTAARCTFLHPTHRYFINHVTSVNTMELSLSKQEWVILQYTAIAWTCFQSWDLCWELYDRYNKRTRLQSNQAQQRPAGEP